MVVSSNQMHAILIPSKHLSSVRGIQGTSIAVATSSICLVTQLLDRRPFSDV